MITLCCDWCRKEATLDHRYEQGVRQYPDSWRTDYLGGPSDSDPLRHYGARFEFCGNDCRDKFCDKMIKDANTDPREHRGSR